MPRKRGCEGVQSLLSPENKKRKIAKNCFSTERFEGIKLTKSALQESDAVTQSSLHLFIKKMIIFIIFHILCNPLVLRKGRTPNKFQSCILQEQFHRSALTGKYSDSPNYNQPLPWVCLDRTLRVQSNLKIFLEYSIKKWTKNNKQLHMQECSMEYSAHEHQLIYEVISGIFFEYSVR